LHIPSPQFKEHTFDVFPTADYDRVVDVNQRGVFICMREETAIMLKQEPLG
jgi:NAD(P)-dependent dehydrogenase (short-subunit alcohol dehydrogenase family)